MFLNNSGDSVSVVYLTFIHDMINIIEDGYNWRYALLSCLYFNIYWSCLEPVDCIDGHFVSASDEVMDTILDRETEVTHYHLQQLRFFMILLFIFQWYRYKTEEPLLGRSELPLNLISNGWQNTYSSTLRIEEDQVIFRSIRDF
jgi:hypothetical protein